MEITIIDKSMPDDPTLARPRRGRRKATIGRRPLAVAPLSDAACTPKWLADMLPMVDFDPCSNPRSWIRSAWSWSLEKGIDGLKMPWRGSGFENWPYSAPLPWAQKSIDELRLGRCTELIVLCKLDTSTDWWHVITSFDPEAGKGEPLSEPPELWTFDKRLQFDEHPDLIEQRRQETIEKARAKAIAKGKNPDDVDTTKITGESSNNFCSVIVHHRRIFPDGTRGPRLKLASVATLWERGGL